MSIRIVLSRCLLLRAPYHRAHSFEAVSGYHPDLLLLLLLIRRIEHENDMCMPKSRRKRHWGVSKGVLDARRGPTID